MSQLYRDKTEYAISRGNLLYLDIEPLPVSCNEAMTLAGSGQRPAEKKG